jgi:hypothetical protein
LVNQFIFQDLFAANANNRTIYGEQYAICRSRRSFIGQKENGDLLEAKGRQSVSIRP